MKNTNKNINWPTTPTFTIKDVFALNPLEKQITLRVRLTNEKKTGKILELGNRTGGKGRPEKIFAYTPVSTITFKKAESERVNFVDGIRKLVGVE